MEGAVYFGNMLFLSPLSRRGVVSRFQAKRFIPTRVADGQPSCEVLHEGRGASCSSVSANAAAARNMQPWLPAGPRGLSVEWPSHTRADGCLRYERGSGATRKAGMGSNQAALRDVEPVLRALHL